MKKTIFSIIAIILIAGIGIWWWKSSNSETKEGQVKNSTSNYQAERSTINQNIANSGKNNGISNTNTSNSTNLINQQNTGSEEKASKETELAQFTTKIHNKDPKRQNNISITCKALSTKEIRTGEIFSFCDTVGKATTSKGYQEADIYVNGEKKQGLGGGNCQVSTTLYNAVLKTSGLEVIERHQHSGKVPYIQSGKDAAVSYGAYDFKFKNNTGSTIKILMENTSDNITAKIIEIK